MIYVDIFVAGIGKWYEESKVVLNPNVRLEECVVNNGNRLILF